MKTAFIFPAFISEYIGNEIEIMRSQTNEFDQLLVIASDIIEKDLTNLSLADESLTRDELTSQVISYIFSCGLADILIKKGITPDILAGYSMGLYGALYAGRAIQYEEGIRLIKKAFLLSKESIGSQEATMGSIIGLTATEIQELISTNYLQVEIANTNSVHSHLISGSKVKVVDCLERAKETGALSTSLLIVGTPYHSKMLYPATKDFKVFLNEMDDFHDSQYPIISSLNQKIITSANDLKNEVANNLSNRINWTNSFDYLVENDYSQIIECGAGKSLQKISRFTAGDFKVYPMNRLGQIFG